MIFELLTVALGFGGPASFFLYCMYLISKPGNDKHYSKPLPDKINRVFNQ